MKNNVIKFLSILSAVLFICSACTEKKTVEKATDKSDFVQGSETLKPKKEEISDTDEPKELESPTEVNNDPLDAEVILVSTKEELDSVRNSLSGNFRLTKDIVFEDADFEEGGDFYNNGCGWLPIGDDDEPFSGSFDGSGFSVSNLKLDITENGKSGALFGRLEGGVIENLNILDCDINVFCESGDNRGLATAAGLIAENAGTVNKCKVSGNINSYVRCDDKKNFSAAGGICGYNYGTVSNCINEAEISSRLSLDADKNTAIKSETLNEPYVGFCYAGGIAGCDYGTVSECTNYGSVNGETVTTNPMGLVYDQLSAGGIAGDVGYDNKVYDCDNFGNVNGSTTCGMCYTGGIAGFSNCASIERCGNRGEINSKVIESRDDKCASAGGISGGGEVKIKDCYNAGAITAKTVPSVDNNTEYVGLVFVGGVCSSPCEISNCYNIGKINADQICTITGIGGIAFQDIPEGSSGLYYLDNVSAGASREDYATKCTDEEMRRAETYEGFDFDGVWEIDPNAEYPYPTLK